MHILNKKVKRLYKNGVGGKILVRLSLPTTEEDSDINPLYEVLSEKYFSEAERFIISKNDRYTYFLDVVFSIAEEDKTVQIKRSSALKCGASLIKKEDVFDVFSKDTVKLKN